MEPASSAVSVSQFDPPFATLRMLREQPGACPQCGGFKWRAQAVLAGSMALHPWQKALASSEPSIEILVTCTECAAFTGAIGGRRSEDRAVTQAERAYAKVAVLQLARTAKALALHHLERGGRICGDGVTHAICDVCRAKVPVKEDPKFHVPGCLVGQVLGWAQQVSSCDPPAAETGSAAGDFLGNGIAASNVHVASTGDAAGGSSYWRDLDREDLARAQADVWPAGSAHAQADGYSCAFDGEDGGVE